MGKIITIAILFCGFLSLAQERQIETVSLKKINFIQKDICVKKTGVENAIVTVECVETSNFITDEICGDLLSNKNKIDKYTGNVMYNLKLVLPGKFGWLHESIV